MPLLVEFRQRRREKNSVISIYPIEVKKIRQHWRGCSAHAGHWDFEETETDYIIGIHITGKLLRSSDG
jgi:hypothetical protein